MKEIEKAVEQEKQNRREFLKTARTAALTAPAVTLLLASDSKPASAGSYNGVTTPLPTI